MPVMNIFLQLRVCFNMLFVSGEKQALMWSAGVGQGGRPGTCLPSQAETKHNRVSVRRLISVWIWSVVAVSCCALGLAEDFFFFK